MIAASRVPKMSLAQYRDALANAAACDVPALCCNPDRLMLTTHGLQPSAGEIAKLYSDLGGMVTFVGKPYPAIYAAASKLFPQIKSARTLAIGDSLEHDIAGANKSGLPAALVLTGLSARMSRDHVEQEAVKCGAVANFVLPSLRWGACIC